MPGDFGGLTLMVVEGVYSSGNITLKTYIDTVTVVKVILFQRK
jgi:hypothetical protein